LYKIHSHSKVENVSPFFGCVVLLEDSLNSGSSDCLFRRRPTKSKVRSIIQSKRPLQQSLKIKIKMKCWKSKSKWNVEIKNRNLFLKSSTLKLMFLNSVDVAIFFFWQKLNFFKFQSLKMYPETKSVSVQ
jgi:hypothetical protein